MTLLFIADIVTTDEVNYLRLIHLLFRVTCPVVRMFFNDEFKPHQLRKTLNRNKSVMEKQYKKKDGIISKDQFDLLYGQHGQVKGKYLTKEQTSHVNLDYQFGCQSWTVFHLYFNML